MQRAVEEGRRDVQSNPRGLMQRTNLALYETYAGNFQNAVKEAQEVLKRNPKSVSALGALALGHLGRSEEHTSELQSHSDLVCRLLLEKKKPETQRRPSAAARSSRR